MKCTIMSLEAKQAKNGNWYVNVLAQPQGDPFAEEYNYRMWCSEALAKRLEDNVPETIELEKVRVPVNPFKRIDSEGVVGETVCTTLTVVCRQFNGEFVDDVALMAARLRQRLLDDGKLVDVEVDAFAGAEGDFGYLPA